ncbi:MAG: TonB family protein, partial [Thermoanaerobaculales bacterium]|nr:TonB family protein [Thermoanaerobaculales bacterium]
VFTLPPDAGGLRENPDREGGSVDSGGLSFDTQWYDWGPYAKLMLAKIRRNWRIPEIARMGVSGRVKIRFFIERDGTVTGLQIMDESGKPPMDFAARDAIAHSSPFKPLPPELRGSAREGVTITFLYNTRRPEDRGR